MKPIHYRKHATFLSFSFTKKKNILSFPHPAYNLFLKTQTLLNKPKYNNNASLTSLPEGSRESRHLRRRRRLLKIEREKIHDNGIELC